MSQNLQQVDFCPTGLTLPVKPLHFVQRNVQKTAFKSQEAESHKHKHRLREDSKNHMVLVVNMISYNASDLFCCGKMRSTNHIFRKDLRISFSFFADSPLQRERLEFWICTLLNICQEFKWEITLNENIYFPSDSSVERFNNFTALSYFLPYARLNINLPPAILS